MLKEVSKPFQHKKIAIDPKDNSTGAKQKKKAKDWAGTLKRIWRYLVQNKSPLILVLVLVIVSSVFALLGPFIVGMAIDEFIVTRNLDGLVYVILGLSAIYVIHSAAVWGQNFVMIRVAQKTVFQMRSDLFKRLHQLPIAFFQKRQHGELMSRVTNDIENVSSTLNSSVIQVISSVLTLVGILIVMLWLSPLLTLVTLTIIPLMVLGMKWITKRTGKLFKEQQRNLGEVNGFIEETLSGQSIIKTFSQEPKVLAEFHEKNKRLREAGFWAQTISGFIPKLMNVLNNLSFAVIALVGGIFVLNGMVSIGIIVIFAEYARQFTRPLNDLANQFNTILSAIAGAERVFEVIDEKEESADETNAIALKEVKGEVEFKQVSFSYESDENTLRNVSFTVTPGQTVALVGPTGAGKTTVINLLTRFYDADGGQILIDGYEMKKIQRESLRRHMGFVFQDSFLFEGTIRENIRYGRLTASDREVEEAAKLANAHSFIMKLPDQYDTVLKQDGSGISQGQKQLLSIARAIAADPKILVLDEATSNIDTITEVKIQEALQRLMKGRTSFVIAHRLNTIQKADQIIVLQEGELIEKGTHESLLKERGFYYELNSSQISKI
ncbi:ABC transporter ATP-binding protein [Alkalihalobacterium chitinilyticum]|uniref:ABC transporter ATP-binding protein/permease n=1 Tax=Alkalihalobacterium chitinilyticum TaxID=2980103 RepID=A0ABT5VJC1_9BACI|nr:ABC transporter ATP-binding protein [Alkalihalobacterium chitinilyticum]MDE5415548.1 ABC transporter ATP-binding protein/permease [Alkalihalobacterium chitinilyticum]